MLAVYAADQIARYTLSGSSDAGEEFEPHFTFFGFRYVSLEGFPGEPVPENFTGIVLHSDTPPTGSFECSSPLINQLQHNIVWGQKGNFVDVPTDCPQRDERLGWTGDAQVFVRTACFNMNTAGFFTKWLRDLSADQLPSGSVPHVVPDVLAMTGPGELGEAHNGGAAAWGDNNLGALGWHQARWHIPRCQYELLQSLCLRSNWRVVVLCGGWP